LGAGANAAPVSESEPNEPLAAAQNVDAFFSLTFDPNIENFAGVNTSTTVPHVEIISPGDASGTTDFYSFTAAAGDGVTLDIDCGERSDTTCSSAVSIDSYIELYDPTGAPFAFNDDGSPVADTGSASLATTLDSIKEIALCGSGLWTVGVSLSPGSVGIPAGGDYILNISVGPGVGAVDTISTGACPSGPVVPDTGDPGCGFFPNVTTLPVAGSDTIAVPWCMHLSQTSVTNVAGILYAAHYDETEVDLLHTGAPTGPPLFGNVTPFGQSDASPFAVPLSSTFSPLPTSVPGTPSGFRQHVAWLPPSIANASGATVNASSSLNFATFSIHARHTPLSNNAPAFTVASAFPIRHATTSQPSGQFFVWNQTAQSFAFNTNVATNSFYIPFSGVTGAANYANLRLVPEPAGAAALLVGCLMLGLLGILRKTGVAAGR
jgi:hypothetical protein